MRRYTYKNNIMIFYCLTVTINAAIVNFFFERATITILLVKRIKSRDTKFFSAVPFPGHSSRALTRGGCRRSIRIGPVAQGHVPRKYISTRTYVYNFEPTFKVQHVCVMATPKGLRL